MADYRDDYFYFDILNGSISEKDISHPMNIVSIVLYSLTCLLGLPGNVLVIWVAGFKMKRTVNTVWFLNLASADFLCCLSIPFSIVEIALDYHWPYGNLLCKVIPTVILLNMFASVFTLTLISLDRFALVIKPIWSQNHRSLSLAYLLSGAAWFVALLLSMPSIIYRASHFNDFTNTTMCAYDQDSNWTQSLVKKIYVSRFVFGFMIPLFVIVACYSLISRKVSRSSFAQSQKTIRRILGVIVAFFVCWLPYHVVGLMLEYSGDSFHAMMEFLNPLSICLAYMNSCLNPILYVFMGHDFKEKVRLSLRRVLENAFDEDVSRSTAFSREQSSRATNSSEAHL